MAGVRTWIHRERLVLGVLVVSATVHAIAWGGRTRAMGDSADYRTAARVVFSGWGELTERAPGYPFVLWVTGSTGGETVALYGVQTLLHLVAVLLVVDLARRVGVTQGWRVLTAVLLVTPPVMMKVVYAGSEAVAEVLVVLVAWLAWRWQETDRVCFLVAIGPVLGAAALVRPTFQLLFLPMLVLLGWWAIGAHRWRRPALALVPAVLVIIVVSGYNGARFDSPGLSPLLPWHLSSKVALFVEDLPDSEEPARFFLVERRDELLVEEPTRAAATFAFDNRSGLAEVTGIDEGPELDRYMLGLDLQLIARQPVGYLDSVARSSVRYVQFDEQKAGFGDRAWLGRAWLLVHGVLAVVIAAVAVLLPGAVLVRGVDRPRGRLLAVGVLLVVYTGAVSVALETGSARLRSPTDPLIVLLAVVGVQILREMRRPTAGEPASP